MKNTCLLMRHETMPTNYNAAALARGITNHFAFAHNGEEVYYETLYDDWR